MYDILKDFTYLKCYFRSTLYGSNKLNLGFEIQSTDIPIVIYFS